MLGNCISTRWTFITCAIFTAGFFIYLTWHSHKFYHQLRRAGPAYDAIAAHIDGGFHQTKGSSAFRLEVYGTNDVYNQGSVYDDVYQGDVNYTGDEEVSRYDPTAEDSLREGAAFAARMDGPATQPIMEVSSREQIMNPAQTMPITTIGNA